METLEAKKIENKKVAIQGKYRKEKTALKAAIECLKYYYSIDIISRNIWRFNNAVEAAKRQIKETGKVDIEGAQWGGKWGNYKRRVALNSKGVYEYVEGFNTKKELGF